VLDIMGGLAVHAVAGRREQYQPLRSPLCRSSDPLEAASTFKTKLGFKDLYVADLTAILGGEPSTHIIQRIRDETNLNLMVDVGVKSLSEAEALRAVDVSRVVIGTETLPDLGLVREAVDELGGDHVTVSLDMREGRILSKSADISRMTPLTLAKKLKTFDVASVILLDLSKVGTRKGANLDVVKTVIPEVSMEVIVGGGLRSIEDLRGLRDLQVDGVLIATALHTGEISKEILESEGFL